jgi:hypothetical protein
VEECIDVVCGRLKQPPSWEEQPEPTEPALLTPELFLKHAQVHVGGLPEAERAKRNGKPKGPGVVNRTLPTQQPADTPIH